jgi:hypothetical protein
MGVCYQFLVERLQPIDHPIGAALSQLSQPFAAKIVAVVVAFLLITPITKR